MLALEYVSKLSIQIGYEYERMPGTLFLEAQNGTFKRASMPRASINAT